MNDFDRQTLALAGVFQAAELAKSVANRGMVDSDPMQATINSVYAIDADSVVDVFGGLQGLQLGLRSMTQNLDSSSVDTELLRYAFALVALAGKFAQRKDLQIAVREGIDATTMQVHHLGNTHDNVLARLGEIYLHTISTLRPRVLVNGKPLYLQQERLVSWIRAILLAGVRSALLWGQVGGGRFKLLFARKRFAANAGRLLEQAKQLSADSANSRAG